MTTAMLYDINAARERRSNRMENQKNGYIPLYRSIKKKLWAKDVYLRTLWENILFAATRKPRVVNFKGHSWMLDTGQLVATSADLGLELCDRNGEPTSRHSVERMLRFFEKEGMISVHAERRKGTLITVLNYAEYAEKTTDYPAHNNAHNKASNGEGLEHPPAHKSAHHEQECNNNNNKNTTSENSKESPDSRNNKNFVIRSGAAIQTPKGDKWGTDRDLEAARWIYQKVQDVSPSSPEPSWASWANDIRLMRNALKATHREICEVFAWANTDGFWYSNILSPAKLRSKWPTLRVQMTQPGRKKRECEAKQSPHWNSREAWEDFI